MIDSILNAIYEPVIMIVCGMAIVLIPSAIEKHVDDARPEINISASELDHELVKQVNRYMRLK